MRKPVIAGGDCGDCVRRHPGTSSSETAPSREYVVLYERGVSAAQGRDAVEDAGGRIIDANSKIGVATVRWSNRDFAREATRGGARSPVPRPERTNRAGADGPNAWQSQWRVERAGRRCRAKVPAAGAGGGAVRRAQWDMEMIGATREGSYRSSRVRKGVRVGILDTGVDGTHPDIAPNSEPPLSRNFVTDMPDDRRARARMAG